MVAACEIAARTTDGEIERKIIFHLAETQRPGLKRLVVEVVDGCVSLRGRVQSFYEKQLAIHSCQSVTGLVRAIDVAEVAVAN
jgi:osmotically-inducible protein OsmY